jgi:hypothetical protein
VDHDVEASYNRDWDYCRVNGLGFLPFFMCPHHDQMQSNGIARAASFDDLLHVSLEQLSAV